MAPPVSCLGDAMQIAEIVERRSVSPRRLSEPGPTPAQLNAIIEAACAAPDHRRLRPWRFVLIRTEAREAFADLFEAAARETHGELNSDQVKRAREKAANGACLIAVIAEIRDNIRDVPPHEQWVSVGAAVQNILLAAKSFGFGSMLVSGDKVSTRALTEGFGLAPDELLLGFVAIGTISKQPGTAERPGAKEKLSYWPKDEKQGEMMKTTTKSVEDPCCVDERTGIGGLVPVNDAISRGLSVANEVDGTEVVELDEAIGRVLAEDLVAPFPMPPFDNSAMDGYVFRSEDLSGAGPWRLRVAGRVAAGDNANEAGGVGEGEAFRIFTGAGIPKGGDAVIMQEHVRHLGNFIELDKPVIPGNCIRRSGEDAVEGSLLLPKGSPIGAREIGAIASVGLPQIKVRRKVRIALFCTGSELRQPGESLAPGQIYNSNRFILMAALRQPWIELSDMGAVVDDPDELRDVLTRAAVSADMVVTTGGVSVGEEDHMVEQLRGAGGKIEVMKIAMKPGKPLSIGTLNDAVFVGLPGNPVAAFTTWKIIGSRIAEKMSGQGNNEVPVSQVEASESFTRRPGRQEFRPAKIVGLSPEGRPQVQLLDQSFSAKISLICKSDGFAVIPADCDRIASGDRLDFVRL